MARLVVFKDSGDLVELRELLYGDLPDQRRGLSKAKAYQIRGNLPASVHVTCLIIAAIHNDVPGSDFFAIRQTYAMSLIRFVNETLDANQVGKSVVPLHILASEMGLPNTFVELRHAATHEELPSVYLLRKLANGALQWLYGNFWSKQKTPSKEQSREQSVALEVPTDSESLIGRGDRIKELLKEWRRQKRLNAAAQPPARLLYELNLEWTADEAEFLTVCLNRNILVPAGTSSIPRKGALVVALWFPLFSAMGNTVCEELLHTIIDTLSSREWPLSRTENRKYPVLETWAEHLASFATSKTINLLEQSPRPWNARVLAIYACATADIDLYNSAKNMANFTRVTIPAFPAASSSIKGWKKVSNWSARPLGCS